MEEYEEAIAELSEIFDAEELVHNELDDRFGSRDLPLERSGWHEFLSSIEDYQIGIDEGLRTGPEYTHHDAREYLEWCVLEDELVSGPVTADIRSLFDNDMLQQAQRIVGQGTQFELDPFDEYAMIHAVDTEEGQIPGADDVYRLNLLISHEREYVAANLDSDLQPGELYR